MNGKINKVNCIIVTFLIDLLFQNDQNIYIYAQDIKNKALYTTYFNRYWITNHLHLKTLY